MAGATIKKTSPIPLDINWHEGMLLSQHHFQQNDLRNAQILANQIKLLSSFHFGVRHLRFDQVTLADGLYKIYEMEAVFPDGLIFSYFPGETHNDLRPLEIDAKSVMKDDENEITVYIVIAESQDGTSPILSNPARYYSVDGTYIKDDNILDNEVKIPRLFPAAFLNAREIPDFCVGFPLTKIIRLDGVYQVKNWTPPCFFIAKTFPMWNRALKLTLSIREKATFLSDKLKNQTGSANAVTGTEQILKQLLMVLPKLEALVYSDQIRPYDLYEELAYVLGMVSVIRPTEMIPVMHPYNHYDIDASIYQIVSLIEHYIATIDKGFTTIVTNKKDRFFFHKITEKDIDLCKKYNKKIYIGVKGVNRTAYHDTEIWMNNAIIVSDFAIEDVRERRVKGAKRTVASEDMISKIMPGSGVMLFEVTINSEYIRSDQNLHIFNPGDTSETRPLEIMLYIPNESKGGK
ncbi:MAG: type VI secretion system baseplate subunit TssK [Holosporales bacterium]|jgi:type VI secretion system protein ImpJ|nr:type VI secretion system baseplate subunit TssK [Holosporales bacterium]